MTSSTLPPLSGWRTSRRALYAAHANDGSSAASISSAHRQEPPGACNRCGARSRPTEPRSISDATSSDTSHHCRRSSHSASTNSSLRRRTRSPPATVLTAARPSPRCTTTTDEFRMPPQTESARMQTIVCQTLVCRSLVCMVLGSPACQTTWSHHQPPPASAPASDRSALNATCHKKNSPREPTSTEPTLASLNAVTGM